MAAAVESSAGTETYQFQANSAALFDIIAKNGRRTNVFPTQIAFNAIRALDEVVARKSSDSSPSNTVTEISIKMNEDGNLVEITDTGTGMTKKELVEFLGTIGASGRYESDPSDASNGVGFLTVFNEASHVQVITKSDSDEQYMWESFGDGSFTIRPYFDKTLLRGTRVVFKSKSDISPEPLAFVRYPVKCDDSFGINEQSTLPWDDKSKSFTYDDYFDILSKIVYSQDAYISVKCVSVETPLSFNAILFIPSATPLAYLQTRRIPRFQLLSNGVCISRSFTILPQCLEFIMGCVDVKGIPLNFNQDKLSNESRDIISKILIDNCLEMFEELAKEPDRYEKFFELFDLSLKLGVETDSARRSRWLDLLLYRTSKSTDHPVSLKHYVSRMKEDQKFIYYLSGPDYKSLITSVFMEEFVKRDIEVIFMVDSIDEEIMANHVDEYVGKKFVNISSTEVDLPQSQSERESYAQAVADFEATCRKMKDVLGDSVASVVVSKRLVKSPFCVSTASSKYSANRQRILLALPRKSPLDDPRKGMVKCFEINPNHPTIKLFKERLLATDGPDKACIEALNMCFHAALVASGFNLENPRSYTKKLHQLVETALLAPDLKISAEPESDGIERLLYSSTKDELGLYEVE